MPGPRRVRAIVRHAGRVLRGLGPEYALVVAEPIDPGIRGQQHGHDLEPVCGVAWHAVDDEHPLAGLTPEFWAPLAPLLRELVHGR